MANAGALKSLNDDAVFKSHGGALDRARQRFPDAPEPWIDLSTGLNPVPYPVGAIPAEAFARLPDSLSLAALEHAASRRFDVPIGAEVVAGAGSQSIIQRLPALCPGRDVRLLGRTYSEYERLFRGLDARVETVPSASALAGADVAVVVNPNNPDGRFVPPDDLASLSQRVGILIVDEAFADALPIERSVVPRLVNDRMIVLRSFGKICGLAGLRLGFAVLAQSLAGRLRRELGPWPVSGPAISIGTNALNDDAWFDSTRARLRADGQRLSYLLGHVGASPVGGTPLFRLVSHPAAPSLFRWLGGHGILTRPFTDEPGWLRFGFPGNDAEWTRLERALVMFR